MAWASVLVAVAVLLIALVVLRHKGKDDEGDYSASSLDFAANLALAAYLLVLAYAAVLVYDASGAAETDALAESESLTELYWAVAPLPDSEQIRSQIKAYTTETIQLDWPRMSEGELAQEPTRTLEDLRASIMNLRPVSDADKELRSTALDRISDVTHARIVRADDAGSSLDDIFMISLVLSGLVVIVLPWFARARPTVASIAGDVVRVGVVVGGILIILVMEHPYSGMKAVQPEAFAAAQEQYEQIDRRFPGAP